MISCVICGDLFTFNSEEIYVTQCGHMFHFHCLSKWLKRSESCPQCRHKTNQKTIYKVFFNITNTDQTLNKSLDACTLQNKLDDTLFKIALKEKDVKIYSEKYHKAKEQNKGLRVEIAELENTVRNMDSNCHSLKDQISYFKSRAKENDKLTHEINGLKTVIRHMENVQKVVDGTREQVNDILKTESNIEALAILVATLKKTLLDVERKNRQMENNLKHIQNDALRYKRDCKALEESNSELKINMNQLKNNWNEEKKYFKMKIKELNEIIKNNELGMDVTNSTLNRIMVESPAPLPKRPKLNQSSEAKDYDVHSPSIAEKVKNILDSDSPYLPLKTSSGGIGYPTMFNTKFTTRSPNQKQSIFRSQPLKIENVKRSMPPELSYNGLGGHSKDDIFPDGKSTMPGFKRHKPSTSSLSSAKFRKLAPNSNSKKITDFIYSPTS